MKLIKPSEISAMILTLFEESDERVIIISPYMKISNWYKLLHKIDEIKRRGIFMEIYVRDDPENLATYRDLDKLGLNYKRIPHLHCKLYMNERSGIVTSLNLLLSSEINSLEIGYSTETKTEYKDLLSFYHRYVRYDETNNKGLMTSYLRTDQAEIKSMLREELNRAKLNVWLWYAGNAIHINSGKNSYCVTINDGSMKIKLLTRVTALSKKESIAYQESIREKLKDLSSMEVNLLPVPTLGSFQMTDQIRDHGTDHMPDHVSIQKPENGVGLEPKHGLGLEPEHGVGQKQGPRPEALLFKGQAGQKLKSKCISEIRKEELVYIMEAIKGFIVAGEHLT